MSIDNAAENAFVVSNIGLDSLIGASDQTTEGTWRWDNGSIQFWSGTSSGSAVGGHYANWDLFFGQPDNGGFFGNEDCGLISAWSGLWFDVSCSTGYWYVCEEDLCPSDPIKESPGQCGCGEPDTDTDNDGTADCNDACPADPSRSALPCSPDTTCSFETFGGSQYFFCNDLRNYATAKGNCEAIGMQLARVDSADENAWIAAQIATDRWIGGTDAASEGVWRWEAGGDQFWQGTSGGSAVAGAYTNWATGQPNNFGFGQHCLTIFGNGQWDDEGCSEVEQYICEDACPFTDKAAPGQCGCTVADIDTDEDGVADCIDACPADADKVTPGLTGCGNSDVDTDGDGVPDALDDAPTDPTQQTAGSCGTAADPTPMGTPCDDGPCPGVHECDGDGHCGDTDCAPPDCGDAEIRTFRGMDYWFCEGPATWEEAAAACRDLSGRTLAQIQDEAEQRFVAAVIGVDSWIGANDRGTDGEWRWAKYATDDGSRFWNGGAEGTVYYGGPAFWASGSPGGGGGEACGAMSAATGAWDDLSCSTSRGFVCEIPSGGGRTKDDLLPRGPRCLAESYGGECSAPEACDDDEASLFPGYDLSPEERELAAEAVKEALRDCEAACAPPATETPCRTACAEIGGVAAPPSGSPTCPSWEANYLLPICGFSEEPIDPVDCTTDEDCESGEVCRFHRFVAPLILRRVCGTQNPDEDPCPFTEDPDVTSDCAEPSEIICADDEWTQTIADWDEVELDEQSFDAEAHFGEPSEPEPEEPYADATQTPCSSGPCAFGGPSHPWCRYASDQALHTPEAVDNDHGADTGEQPLIRFDFDPNMRLQFSAGIGALGLPRPELKADAGLAASIKVTTAIVPIEATFTIIDALAALDGSRCKVTTDRSRLVLLGIDFLPEEEGAELDEQECKAGYAAFEEATNRANKALRDARMLLEQYYTAIDDEEPLGNLCEQIADTGMTPAGFPGLASGVTCAEELPAATIGRFVEYYRRTVVGFDDPELLSLAKAAVDLQGLAAAADLNGAFPLFEDSGREEATIAQARFFIGPIPCDVEVYAALAYGVDIRGFYRLDAGAFIETALFNPGPSHGHEVAFIGVHGEPWANAFLGVFAGVGFDVGVAAAKFGVDAQLSLVRLGLPATAGAGLELVARPDERESPEDLRDPMLSALLGELELPPDTFLVPPKRYEAKARYVLDLKAKLTDVLSGSVNARLKLKFLFFSKSWRKQLFAFTGLCPPGPEGVGCGGPLITASGSLDAPLPVPWGAVEMPTPLPQLMSPALAWASLGVASPVGTGEIDLDQAEELFFDNICTCIATDDEERPCYRTDDCCDHDDDDDEVRATCFEDPDPMVTGTFCRTCRAIDDSCVLDSDCCLYAGPEEEGTVVCAKGDDMDPFATCRVILH